MTDPFTVLGVDETAGDDEIKQRYLALVRAYPPDLEPQRFQAYRAAYEQLRDNRKRLEANLLTVHDAALLRLRLSLLAEPSSSPGRASAESLRALLVEGVEKAVAQ